MLRQNKQLKTWDLPADVAADDDVASEHGSRGHITVDGVGDDGSVHRELDGARVHDADDVAGSGRREEQKNGRSQPSSV